MPIKSKTTLITIITATMKQPNVEDSLSSVNAKDLYFFLEISQIQGAFYNALKIHLSFWG